MEKRTLLLLGPKGTGALALFGTGIGAYVLLSPNPKDINIKYWTQQESDSNIVKSNAITSSWTSVTHYPESKFFITCNKSPESDKGKGDIVNGEPSINGVSVPDGVPGAAGAAAAENPTSTPSAGVCKKYIESKAHGGHPIWVKQQQNDLGTNSLSWDTYKFTFKEGVEGDIKEYYGLCFPIPGGNKPDPDENPCSFQNLPDGWSKSLIPKQQQSSS